MSLKRLNSVNGSGEFGETEQRRWTVLCSDHDFYLKSDVALESEGVLVRVTTKHETSYSPSLWLHITVLTRSSAPVLRAN